jgi:hypothetical protein
VAVAELGSLGHLKIMGIILSFLLPMLATIPLAGMICRIRIARKKPISYGTLFLSACSVPLLIAFIATCIQPDIWWSREHKMTPEIFLTMLGFIAAMCVLPALGVVVYYQRRSKKHETVA